MFQQIFNWRTGLAIIAISIVIGTIFYSRYLARKIAAEEKEKVTFFGEALKIKASSNDQQVLVFTNQLTIKNQDIPIIETNEKDSITGYVNLDSNEVAGDNNYLRRKVNQYRKLHDPVKVEITTNPSTFNKYYYGESRLLNEVRYYPLVQLFIVGLFIIITIMALRSSYRSVQNQLWAGMAKETAHQLGTPVSSLEGWVEMMKEKPDNEKLVNELRKDVTRLRLVSDRFGKIGSTPHLERFDLVGQINNMVDYIKKRAAGKVNFVVNTHGDQQVYAMISGPLFDWVIENLLKNSLDAMEGKGTCTIDIQNGKEAITIDISDTGKGISRQNVAKVFKPGFTTKKRGWGLGLTLSKRIIEQYHKGQIFVRHSEPGKGTTFRIVLKK